MIFYVYNSYMSLTSKILIGMLSGLIFGSFISLLELEANPFIKVYLIDGLLNIGGQIFISLLKLMVVPLVFFSLTSGVSSLDKNLSLGRIAGKTLGLYLITTAIAISIGLSIAVFLNPGNNLDLQTSTLLSIPESPNIKDIILNIIPSEVTFKVPSREVSLYLGYKKDNIRDLKIKFGIKNIFIQQTCAPDRIQLVA